MIATLKITKSKWQHCKFDNWRWLSVLFCCERKWTKNNSIFSWKVLVFKFTKLYEVRCAHNEGDVVNFTTVACRISSRLKRYKNYKNRLRLAKVIVKNKMSRFLWFTVYIADSARTQRPQLSPPRAGMICTAPLLMSTLAVRIFPSASSHIA